MANSNDELVKKIIFGHRLSSVHLCSDMCLSVPTAVDYCANIRTHQKLTRITVMAKLKKLIVKYHHTNTKKTGALKYNFTSVNTIGSFVCPCR